MVLFRDIINSKYIYFIIYKMATRDEIESIIYKIERAK